MKGFDPRTMVTAALLALAAFGASGPAAAQPRAQASTPPAPAATTDVGARFDAMVADAKAMMLVDPGKTIEKARAAEAEARALQGRQRTIAIATAQWLQGEAYLRLNDLDHAQPMIDRAYAAVADGSAPTKLNGDILLSRGGLHTAKADVAAALADYQAAHTVFRDLGETRSRAVALLSIALLYQEAKDYENALRYSSQASEVYRGDPSLLLAIYNNRGVCLKELGRFAEAEKQFKEALSLARTMKSPGREVQILRNIARAQLATNNVAAADRTIADFVRVSRAAGMPTDSQDLGLAAQAALQHGDLGRATTLIERTFAGVDLRTTTLAFREGHQTAYDLFKKTGDERQALVHLEALKRLDDQTSTLAASTNTALAAARFDFANQELKISRLQAAEAQRKYEAEQARAQTQRVIFIGAGVATLIIVSLLGFGLVTIRRSRNEVRAANIDLAATNAALGKALAAKTEFLATTSHEIRTPLNGILGMTQVMLADRRLDEPTRDRIEVVHGAGLSMRALVDDILDVAKMETGNMTIEREPFNLKATLTEVSRMWEEQARGKGVAFTLDLADCPDRIEGDAARLRQITFNLLSNALKFTASGSVCVRAFAEEGGARPLLKIEVRDTGIGIPADKYELIFESFRQVDAGTTRKFGGTGLGLAICRNLARAMDGDVTVRSQVSEGSTFTLVLPLVRAAEPEAVEEVAEAKALVILDRNPISRSMLRAVLEPRAGTILFAATPDEAAGLMAAGGVSRLLIDDATLKAGGDVPAALATLSAAAGASGVFTALLWSAPSEDQRAEFAASGVDLVIGKPIAGAALGEMLFPLDKSDMAGDTHLVTRAA